MPFTRTIRRRSVVAAMAVLGFALVNGLAAVVRQDRGAERVYTVAQVTTGLAQHPAAWSGRTLNVRGRAVILPCPRTAACWPSAAVLVDLREPGSRIRLTWARVNPLLSVLLRIPYVGQVALGRVGGIGVYRVLIVRSSRVVPADNLPHYFPYTSRTVFAYDDQALMVNGLN
jgi:hypothetical protein